ncbi:hypothetical protein PPERSA_07375 [Pseudocohnilembus persalinus]|uniref:Uncharacterized protein n=1 Tax=Pseudocohnilembus persalinus TaxID=266149 RepID=A0A0V0Q9H7_PSEPJ|nr:hypothetical protein PPERSA_07375 [Pseudocohnilembus persalinus]|eukprot:KRW98877.1 hypothetical protein PPERSA_07375 [Pseudocohnilembus persalinus]
MKQALQNIQDRLQKQNIPSDKAQKLNHFNKLFELFHSVASHIDKKLDSIKEKSIDLRVHAASALQQFLLQINADFLAGVYENINQVSIKILEESQKKWEIRKNLSKAIQVLFERYLNENIEKMIQDQKMTKKGKKEIVNDKKNNNNGENQAENEEGQSKLLIQKLIHLLNTNLDQYPSLRLVFLEIFYNMIEDSNEQVSVNFEISFSNDSSIYLFRDIVSKMFKKITFFLSTQNKLELLDYLKNKLVDFSKAMKSTYERTQGDQSNKSFQALTHQVILALRLLYVVLQQLDIEAYKKIQSANELAEPLMSFFEFQNKQFFMLGAHCIKAYYEASPKHQAGTISLFLNLTTIKLAELESFRENDGYSKEGISIASAMEGNAIILGLLIQNLNLDIHSVPFDIANSIFDISKQIIKNDTKLLQKSQIDQDSLKIIQIRNSIAWTLLNSITCLDSQWFKNKSAEQFELWNQCLVGNINQEAKNDPQQFLYHVNLKRKALKGINEFLKQNHIQIDEHICKIIANQLIQFYEECILPNTKNQNKSSSVILLAKVEFIQCLKKISPKIYSSKINTFVQSCIEDIFMVFSEDFASSLKYQVPLDDLIIFYSQTGLYNKKMKLYNLKKLYTGSAIEKLDNTFLNYDKLFLNSKEQYSLNKSLNFLQFEYLTKILTSSYFTPKNKLNLLKYLYTNLSSITKAQDFNNKHIKIVPYLILAILIVKQILEDQEKQPETVFVEVEFFEYLRQLSELTWSVNHQSVRSLQGILYAKLFLVNRPKNYTLDKLFKPIYEATKSAESAASAVAIFSYICKYVDYESIQSHFQYISNAFVKSCNNYNNDNNIQVWIMFGLAQGLKKYQANFLQIFTGCVSILYENLLFILNQSDDLQRFYLIQIMENFFNILTKNKEIVQEKKVMSTQIHNLTWLCMNLQTQYDEKFISQNNLRVIYSSIFKSEKIEKIAFDFIERNIQHIREVQNLLFSEDFSNVSRNEQPEEDDEFDDNNIDQKKKEKKKEETKPLLIPTQYNHIDICLNFRIYLSSKVYAMYQKIINVIHEMDDPEKRASQISFWILQIFKMCSITYEQIKLNALKTLLVFIKEIKTYREDGTKIQGQIDYLNQKEGQLIVQNFAAQLDAAISSNLKNFDQNLPEINYKNQFKVENVQDEKIKGILEQNLNKLPEKQVIFQSQFHVLLYLLSANCAAQREEAYLKKLTQKFQDLTLLNNFNQKQKVLEIIQQLLGQDSLELKEEDLEFLQNILENYLDYSFSEYDIRILQIEKILLKRKIPLKISLIETIILRYHQEILEKQMKEQDFVKEKQILLASYNLYFSSVFEKQNKNLENQEKNDKEQMILNLLGERSVIILTLFQESIEYIDLNNFLGLFENLLGQQFQVQVQEDQQKVEDKKKKKKQNQNQNDEQENQDDEFDEFEDFQENESKISTQISQFQQQLALLLIGILGENYQKLSVENLENQEQKDEQEKQSQINQQQQEQKRYKLCLCIVQVIPGVSNLCSRFFLEIQSYMVKNQENPILEVEQKNKILEILRLYLLIFLLSNQDQKSQFFEQLFRICLLFIDKAFNLQENQEIFTFVNQILKKIVNQVEIPQLQKIALQFNPKMRLILSNLLKQDPRIIQQQQQKQREEQLKKQQQQKEQSSKIKLKMFAN